MIAGATTRDVVDPAPSSAPESVASPRIVDRTFPKSNRILRRADFLRIQASAQRYTTPRVAILWVAAPTPDALRIGITTSKKVGNAPVRVQVRRWIREAFRLNKAAMPAGTDFVVVARAAASTAGFHALEADLLRWAKRCTRAIESDDR